MTTAYTSLLGLALPVTGELQGTWGDTVNNSITSLLDTAISGTTTLSTDADVTLTTTTGAANQARQAIILCSGARTALRTITAPAQSKIYTIINATTGGFSVKLVGVGPTTGLTIPNGASAVVAWNGSDFIEVGSATVGNLTVNGNLSVTGTTTLTGAATLTANPTLSAGTANGVAYLNGSKVVTTGSALTFDGSVLTLAPNQVTFGGSTILALGSGSYFKAASTNGFLVNNAADTLNFFKIDASGNAIFYPGGSEAMRLTSTGLGIGTSSPDAGSGAKLTVKGIYLDVGGNDAGYGTQLIASSSGVSATSIIAPTLTFWTGANLGRTERMRLDSSGNLGLGVTPSAWSGLKAFEIAGVGSSLASASNNNLFLSSNAWYNGTNWRYGTSAEATQYQSFAGAHKWYNAPSGTAGNAITFTQAMTLDASGNLLVGTTTAVEKLTIGSTTATSSGINLRTTQTDFSIQPSNSAGGGVTIGVGFVSGGQGPMIFSVGSERARIDSSGNLLVGGSSSDLSARVMCIGSSGLAVQYAGTTGTYLNIVPGAANGTVDLKFDARSGAYPAATFWTGNTERARIDSSGNLLVGKTDPSAAVVGTTITAAGLSRFTNSASTNTTTTLETYSTGASAFRFYVGFGGTVYATSTTITAISDQRLKENIRDLDDGLETVMALKPRKFDWKAGKGKDIKDDRGFIAQEFEQVLPDMVEEWRDPAPEGEEPYKAVNANLIPTLVKAIQEQQAIIEQLKADVAALKGN